MSPPCRSFGSTAGVPPLTGSVDAGSF
ncbi:hypothetical protein CCACVL1_06729 [Corchorus capsularis]|uniref:Uncharacterized protein n=1 Tax=Corchorus capsularis TaxID=210143 RepID=A0A1R3JDM4_COCAP|nr:hypothetical protein CCACVL1_06729 [Corchorus capsularis]